MKLSREMFQWHTNNMSDQKIIILRGLPASGKSLWAKKFIKDNPNYIRVNKDDIRAMMSGEWSKDKERLVIEIRDSVIRDALIHGKSIIVDDTNFNTQHIEDIEELSRQVNYDLMDEDLFGFEVKEFNTPVWECIERDSKRENPVGAKVIWKMYNQYLAHAEHEKKSKWLQQKGKPKVLIVDIDGTLAHMNNRTPYDYTKVKNDFCDVFIKDIVEKYDKDGFLILIVSGREDSCYDETKRWLYENDIPYDRLFMRKTEDKRSDDIIKKEIYENEIEPFYSVFFCLDDRDRVVKLWRSLGLKCLQVEFGSF